MFMISPNNYTKVYPLKGFAILFLCLFLFSLVGVLLIGIVNGGEVTTASLRVSAVIQDCFIFLLPALVTALIMTALPAKFLSLDSLFTPTQLLLALLCIIVSMPAMNLIVKLNSELVLPESLHSLEMWMRASEDKAQASVTTLLGAPTYTSLVIDILIVGVLAGLSEEIFFRGAILKLFRISSMNIHLAIWLTALIFTTFHLQFYGFVPRLLLGAYFGYLVYWSGSIWLPILTHIFNNSLVVVTMWMSQREGEEAMSNITHFGETSFTLIIASIILTACVIKYLVRTQRIERSESSETLK